MTGGGVVVVRHATPEEFLAHAGGFLGSAEVEHNLHWGLCTQRIAHPERADPELYLLTVVSGGEVVAALSARILAASKRFAFLFTDLGNPTSNAIYERLGYRRVGEWADWIFE